MSTALVLLPGLAGRHSEFAAQVAHFGPGRRVLALDPFVDGDLSLTGQANRIVELARRAGLGEFVLLGHSAGGMVALALAGRPPEALAGVVVLDSPVLLPRAVRAALRLPLSLLSTPWSGPLLRRFFQATFTGHDPAAWRAEVLDRLAATPAPAARTLTRNTFTYNSAAALAAIRVPALVIRANIPIRLDRLPPAVQRADLSGVGHWPQMHAPDRLNALLDDFLSETCRGSRSGDAVRGSAGSARSATGEPR